MYDFSYITPYYAIDFGGPVVDATFILILWANVETPLGLYVNSSFNICSHLGSSQSHVGYARGNSSRHYYCRQYNKKILLACYFIIVSYLGIKITPCRPIHKRSI